MIQRYPKQEKDRQIVKAFKRKDDIEIDKARERVIYRKNKQEKE